MAIFSELPLLYPILDAGLLARAGVSIEGFACELREAGIRFLQYRDKEALDEEVVARAALLRRIFPRSDSCLILNDRVDLVRAAGFDGAHIGQDDIEPARARAILGRGALLGLSTHNENQLRLAAGSTADYLAVGPIFSTTSKLHPDPVVGLDAIRLARRLTPKPIVAIGGISRANCLAVRESGADSAAVISGLLPCKRESGESVSALVREFVAALSHSSSR